MGSAGSACPHQAARIPCPNVPILARSRQASHCLSTVSPEEQHGTGLTSTATCVQQTSHHNVSTTPAEKNWMRQPLWAPPGGLKQTQMPLWTSLSPERSAPAQARLLLQREIQAISVDPPLQAGGGWRCEFMTGGMPSIAWPCLSST